MTDLPAGGAVSGRRATAIDNLHKLAVLGDVLDRLAAAGVPVIVLKGALFLRWLYEVDERGMGDVDLLIRREDTERFLTALALPPLSDPAHGAWIVPVHEFTVEYRGVFLDVHWELHPAWLSRVVPVASTGLWQRALPVGIEGRGTLRLGPEDQILHQAAHEAFHHMEWSGRVVEDMRRLLVHEQIDWTLLLRLARSQRLRTALWFALTRPALRGLVPRGVVQALRPPPWGRFVIRPALWLQRHGASRVAQVLMTESPADLPRMALTVLAPEESWLRRRYPSIPSPALRRLWHAGRAATHAATTFARQIGGERRRAAGPR